MASHPCAAVGCAGIQTDTKTRRAAVGIDLSVVWNKVVLGIFRGNTTLHGMATQQNLLLWWNPGFVSADRTTLGDPNLGLYDINASDFLRDRMFDLDAWIHLDKVELAGINILQKLHRAGVVITDTPAQTQCSVADGFTLRIFQEKRWSTLDHFLITALYCAISLKQVHQIALLISEDLHFDMPRAAYQLFKVDLVIAECSIRLSPSDIDHGNEFGVASDNPHATTPATPRGLKHQWIADRVCQRPNGS